jgi:ferredoxin
VCGEDISSVKVSNFKPAPTNKGFSRIPPFLMESAKKLIAIRPTVDVGKCKLCGECVKICPPEAMKVRNRKINIDRNKCINCFCCQEICPHKAIEIKRPLIGRIIASILK